MKRRESIETRTGNRATSPRIIWSSVSSCVRTKRRTLSSTVILGCTNRGVRHGAPRRTRFRNPLDFTWISDFRMDFWISKWISGFFKRISGFQSGFLDFKADFWISKRICGFQSGFLDFKRISGFQSVFLDFI